MSNRQSGKPIFWKSWPFWLVFIVAIYLITVKVEETVFHNFINSEWPTHTINYTQENSPLVGEYINNLTADNKGRVWIGTDYALNVVEPDSSWIIYTGTHDGIWTKSTNDSKGARIQAVAIDKLERTWVGTLDGLYVLDSNGQWTTYDEKSKTVYEHYTSSAIVIDRFNRICAANNDGLRVFLPDGTKIFYTKENSELPDDYITALAEDRQGNIWVGTRTKGIAVIDPNGQWRLHQVNDSQNGLTENWITAILIDDQDQAWIGTERRGISMLSPDGNWTTYDVPAWGMRSDLNYDDKKINALAIDKQGRLWIGTSDALFALDTNGNWIAYTQTNSGLSPDYVRALTVDGKGRLWIATFHEVIVLDLQNELPKPVPHSWVDFRTKILTPIWTITALGQLLLAPSMTFMYSSLYFCSFSYIVLLGLTTFAAIGMIWSKRQKNSKLLSISQLILILSTIGVFILCFLSFLVGMIPT